MARPSRVEIVAAKGAPEERPGRAGIVAARGAPRRRAAREVETVRYGTGASTLGEVLVAAGEGGVVAIALGETRDALLRDLRRRWPGAELVADERGCERLVRRAVAAVEAPRRGLDLELDMRGTALQKKVWRAIQGIAPGQTSTYSAIAREVGSPRAIRAVASACSRCPFLLAVPCHRVVRKDGTTSCPRHRALVEREAPGWAGKGAAPGRARRRRAG